jgi:hypothetical protein
MIMSAQPHLLEMVRALQSPRRFPRRLHRRQEERDQNANDGDHHQEFHERKRGAPPPGE